MRVVALRTLVRVFSWLPLSVAHWLGARLGEVLLISRSRMARVTRTNIALAFPHVAERERRALARASLRNTGRLALESGMVWGWAVERVLATIARVERRELLERALAKGRGVILLCPHLGNWEVANLYVGREFGVTALFLPTRETPLDDIVRVARERGGSRLVPLNTGGIRAALKALRRGECVGILPDQVPLPPHGVIAEFFGHPALTMTLVYRLVSRTGAAVICIASQRLDNGAFEIRFSGTSDAIGDPDPSIAAQAMNDAIEQCVRVAPQQYRWEYKRFRRLPVRVY